MMILTTKEQLRNHKHDTPDSYFRCYQCKQVKPLQSSGGTGYAYDTEDHPLCYECCGKNDLERMKTDGRITLYLTCEPASKMRRPNGERYSPTTLHEGPGRNTAGNVSNWPGTLRFPCHTTVGRHNIAGTRYDVTFPGPDGFYWYGVTYGENTQICHCRRTKRKI